jgi:AraC-like DNA-binding protein
MNTDALSDVLRVVRLSGGVFFQVRLSAPYAVTAMDSESMLQTFAPGAEQVLPFHLVTQGPIWFAIPGDDPVCLEKGDIILLPHGSEHALSDEPAATPLPFTAVQNHVSGVPPTLRWGGGGPEAGAMCGFFHTRSRLFNPLMESLPRVLVVRQDPDRTPWLAATLRRTFDESVADRPGGAVLIERLTTLLFVEVVQRYLEQSSAVGWLGGLSDPVVGRALQLVHQQPSRGWTVEELSKRAGVSRSILAERFSSTVGISPIRYLTAWRMELAASRLMHSTDGIAEIASDVGYESEASFNRAFKRHVGQPPASWRKARQAEHVIQAGPDGGLRAPS